MVETTGSADAFDAARNPGIARPPARKRSRGAKIVLWILALVVVLAIAAVIAAQLAIRRAEPILRARVIDTLATRFDSRVELAEFHVSVLRGFAVEGAGLRLYPRRFLTDEPLIAIAKFQFWTSWLSLLRVPMHVKQVTVDGLAINIPPKNQRRPAPQPLGHSSKPDRRDRIKITADEVLIQNTRLLIGTSKPGKLPLDFEISRIDLHAVGPGKPMRFDATLVNPKPIGDIQSSGYFGPFQQENPGDSQVWGAYSFSHADLATFKGIGGILASTGKYQGSLDHIAVNGQASVPDFRLNTGNHPMPLQTKFQAIVDGTSGDTYLQPVEAQLGKSRFTVNGSVVKVLPSAKGPRGHHITLDVVMTDARIEDFLRLAVRTVPPVMNGSLQMKARIYLPPGDVPVTGKLQLKGNFDVRQAFFSNDKVQQKVNLLSNLGQGRPRDPDLRQSPPQPDPDAPAEVQGGFSLGNSVMQFPSLQFAVPGAEIDMVGLYTLDGSKFDFHGKAKLLAHPSQMTTGWKSLLLKMADPFFAKQGYGTVVPIQVSGTKSEPHFGLDFGHKTPEQKPRKNPAK